MNGYLQTGLGILVSIILFIIGYRQTIGAKKERAKNANHSIHRAIMRRMVLENYAPEYSDITRIIEGKAREFHVSPNDLLSEEQVLNGLYTEVFDSDLISPTQRVEIEKRLGSCFDKIEKEPSEPSYAEYQQLDYEKKKVKENIVAMVLSASLLGAISSVLLKFIETKTFQVEWIISGAGVLVVSIGVLSAMSVFKKSKEIESMPSKRSAQMVSSEFEAEVAKMLIKQGLDFEIEPQIGNLRPDFLIKLNGKKIAVEVKAWDRLVPLSIIRRATNYLNQLIQTQEIDQAILVTRKKTGLISENTEEQRVSVVSINELPSLLKKAA